MPAVRMTQKSRFFGQAKKYISYQIHWATILFDLIKTKPKPLREGEGVSIASEPFELTYYFPLTTPLKLDVTFYRKDNRRCDIDNLLKMVMDLLQKSQIIYNDFQIEEVSCRLVRNSPTPQFIIELSQI